VERVDSLVVSADEDDRVGIDVEDEVVAGLLDLARVAAKSSRAPDPVEIELIDPGIRLEFALERVPGFVLADQAHEERLSVESWEAVRTGLDIASLL